MSGLNIGNLPQPNRRHDPASPNNQKHSKFETLQDSRDEDEVRFSMLLGRKRLAMANGNPETFAAIDNVMMTIRRVLNRDKTASTCASSTCFRENRRRIIGSLSQCASKLSPSDISFIVVIPKNWKIPVDDLHLFNPVRAIHQIRSALNRCGAASADGWLFMGIDGEYEPYENVWQMHLNILATGTMRDVIDRLGTKPNFRSSRKPSNYDDMFDDTVTQKVRQTRKPISNFHRVASYCVKSFWWCRSAYLDEKGELRRSPYRTRLPEPQHTQFLLWMDRWPIADMTLIMGLRVTKTGLKPH